MLSLSVGNAHGGDGGSDCAALSTTCDFSPLSILHFRGNCVTDLSNDGPLVGMRNLNNCVGSANGVGAVATGLH